MLLYTHKIILKSDVWFGTKVVHQGIPLLIMTFLQTNTTMKEISNSELWFILSMERTLTRHLHQGAQLHNVKVEIDDAGLCTGEIVVKITATHKITLQFTGTINMKKGYFFEGEWSLTYDDGEIKAIVDHSTVQDKGWEKFKNELGIPV